jgi:hypothetical protein
MELTAEEISHIIENYKKKRDREKTYYHNVKKIDEEFIKKNRERATKHYAENKDKKLEKYQQNKEFLSARQLFYYYRKNKSVEDFQSKHPDKYTMLKNRGAIE